MSDSRGNANILFRDLYGITVVLFIGLVAILAALADEPVQADAEIKVPGSVMATIAWPQGNTDIDLWMTGPGEPVPVGYSNKGGVLWNLLRDDLGNAPDYTPFNFENAFTRGMPAGEYRVNVHCFRCPELPIEVTLEVAKRDNVEDSVGVMATSTITLNREKEEKTGLAFELDGDGKIVPGSMHTLFAPLRSGQK